LGFGTADLALITAFNTTTRGALAGIWQSGAGLAADDRNVYFQTGNGDVDTTPRSNAAPANFGESFVKLRADGEPSFRLSVAGFFTPATWDKLNKGDTDIGSGGPLLLPGNKLIGGGKEGRFYVLDRDSMAADQEFQAFFNTYHLKSPQNSAPCCPGFKVVHADPGCTTVSQCYVLPSRYSDDQGFGPNIHGAPVYWQSENSDFGLIYKMPEKDFLKAFRYDLRTHRVSESPILVATEKPSDGMPGGFSSISANGGRDGIVWTAFHPLADATGSTQPGRLVAFDAATLRELWRDDGGFKFSKFTPPTIADGKVFLATFGNSIVIYGLRP
jgi:outer membrane protein assembly factor BamB